MVIVGGILLHSSVSLLVSHRLNVFNFNACFYFLGAVAEFLTTNTALYPIMILTGITEFYTFNGHMFSLYGINDTRKNVSSIDIYIKDLKLSY